MRPEDVLRVFRKLRLADACADIDRRLEEYIALFPGHEATISAEHARLQAAMATPFTEDVPSHVDAGEDAGEPFGSYTLIEEVGRGGQGRVYRAVDRNLGRTVAIKLLEGAPTAERVARFSREARAISKLNDPRICKIFEAGEHDGRPFIAMEWVDGETLRHGGTGASDWRRVVELLASLARGLEVAHRRGIVHRDIKPANVMLTPAGGVVILDFGLAALSDEPTLTRTGTQLGTPRYMAPEQIRGDSIDRRIDVYALGVVAYEALSGEHPFSASNEALLASEIIAGSPLSLRRLVPSLPRDLELVVMAAMHVEPERRYSTAKAFADDLDALREGRGVAIRPESRAGRFRRWARREPRTLAMLTVLMLMALALAAGIGYFASQREFIREGRVTVTKRQEAEVLQRGLSSLLAREWRKAEACFDELLEAEAPDLHAITGAVLARMQQDDALGAQSIVRRYPRLRHEHPGFELLARDVEALAQSTDGATTLPALDLDAIWREDIGSDDLFTTGVVLYQRAQGRYSVDSQRRLELRHAQALFEQALLIGRSVSPLTHGYRIAVASQLGDIEAVRSSASALRTLAPESAHAMFWVGFGFQGLDAVAAEAAYRRAIDLDDSLAAAWSNLGSIAKDAGRATEALSCFNEAVALEPKVAPYRLNRGVLFREMGRSDEALSELARATDLDPGYGTAWFARGETERDHGDAETAKKALRRAGELGQADGWSRLGEIQMGEQDAAGALLAFRKALDLEPSASAFRANVAQAIVAAEGPSPALDFVETWCRESPSEGLPWLIKAKVLVSGATRSEDDLEKALQAAERANELTHSSDPAALDVLAMVWDLRGDRDRARECCERALALLHENPDHRQVGLRQVLNLRLFRIRMAGSLRSKNPKK